MKESKVLKDLHKIREKMYEERKNMTPEEQIKMINKSVEDVEKEYGIKLKKAA